jgi:hypothetical protein
MEPMHITHYTRERRLTRVNQSFENFPATSATIYACGRGKRQAIVVGREVRNSGDEDQDLRHGITTSHDSRIRVMLRRDSRIAILDSSEAYSKVTQC